MDLQADLPTVAAALAASLVASDGVIDDQEKKVANELGTAMLPGFNTLIFETLLDGIEEASFGHSTGNNYERSSL